MFATAVRRRVTSTDPRAAPEVRTAVRADLLSVFRIEKRSFGQPWPYAAFEGFLGAPGFLVAEVDDSITGYVVGDTVDAYGAPVGHIKDLAVAPEHRRRGIGRTLLSRGLVALASAGVDRVKLEVRRTNEAARSLYAEFGFEPHHVVPAYYDDGEDAFVMVKHF
ncbi:ribosomal-protein-alanine N-acetyltransferase [Natronomonas salsuginis]|jgi:ribosomal-protein-alanine N-acetyltransferase|uniref:Ribosomal-protein-alanine N-acetyltransferase n=1 Tax=Natronomonas salsuginis TaxID=2217661 RepID=A0A4U5J8Z4_9EURY|nr:ribosomal-protein-alanine N-acetyltransferase [Natronomonas salsuginis]